MIKLLEEGLEPPNQTELHPKCSVFTNFTTLISVPTIGLEPITQKREQILSLPCLPISPSGLFLMLNIMFTTTYFFHNLKCLSYSIKNYAICSFLLLLILCFYSDQIIWFFSYPYFKLDEKNILKVYKISEITSTKYLIIFSLFSLFAGISTLLHLFYFLSPGLTKKQNFFFFIIFVVLCLFIYFFSQFFIRSVFATICELVFDNSHTDPNPFYSIIIEPTLYDYFLFVVFILFSFFLTFLVVVLNILFLFCTKNFATKQYVIKLRFYIYISLFVLYWIFCPTDFLSTLAIVFVQLLWFEIVVGVCFILLV